MCLESLSKLQWIVVIIVFDRITKSLIVFFLDQKIVDSIVDDFVILRLNAKKERLDERDVVRFLEHADNTNNILGQADVNHVI